MFDAKGDQGVPLFSCGRTSVSGRWGKWTNDIPERRSRSRSSPSPCYRFNGLLGGAASKLRFRSTALPCNGGYRQGPVHSVRCRSFDRRSRCRRRVDTRSPPACDTASNRQRRAVRWGSHHPSRTLRECSTRCTSHKDRWIPQHSRYRQCNHIDRFARYLRARRLGHKNRWAGRRILRLKRTDRSC